MILELKDSFKTYTHDQDKVISPKETLKKIRERLKGIDLDILKETRRIDSGSRSKRSMKCFSA